MTHNESLPLISVIMPCYNCANFVAESIHSVLSQDYPQIELIIIDDGSTDTTAAVIQTINESRIRYFIQPNSGVSAARNNGLRQAKGEYIAFIDADDIWHASKLKLQIQLLQYSNYQVCFTSFTVWVADNRGLYPAVQGLFDTSSDSATDPEFSGYIYHKLLKDVYVWTCTVLMHRQVFEHIGYFNTELPIGEDYDYWLRISRHYQFGKLKQSLALYRTTPNSLTHKAPAQNYMANIIDSFVRRYGLVSQDGRCLNKDEYIKRRYQIWYGYGYTCLYAKRTADAANAFLKCIKIQPFKKGAYLKLVECVTVALLK